MLAKTDAEPDAEGYGDGGDDADACELFPEGPGFGEAGAAFEVGHGDGGGDGDAGKSENATGLHMILTTGRYL